MKVHNVIPHQYFSVASAETKDLFVSGHFYGCISLCQAIAESLSRFICNSNKFRVKKDFKARLDRLANEKLISSTAKSAFETIWGSDRDTFHHLNEDVPTHRETLRQRAEDCINALFKIESEIFAFEISKGTIVPLKPIYWPKPVNGKISIHLKPGF